MEFLFSDKFMVFCIMLKINFFITKFKTFYLITILCFLLNKYSIADYSDVTLNEILPGILIHSGKNSEPDKINQGIIMRMHARTVVLFSLLVWPVIRACLHAPAPESTDHVSLKDSYDLFIGGEWVRAPKRIETINPATGEVLSEVAEAGPRMVDRAVSAARQAYDKTWSKLSGADRAVSRPQGGSPSSKGT